MGEFRHAVQAKEPEEGEKEIVDTSKTYVKMCEKAIEIQQVFPTITPDDRSFWVDDFNSGKSVWLPRQDQLQEMVKREDYSSDITDGALMLMGLCFLWCKDNWNLTHQFTSMEQLWLAFVMKEKYSKVWNGEDWIKQG